MLLLLGVDERNTSEKWVAPTQLSLAYVVLILQVIPKHQNRESMWTIPLSSSYSLGQWRINKKCMHRLGYWMVIIGRENVGLYI
jgi:hypothetical protein